MSEQEQRNDKLAVVFDGPPSHESGRFVEVERNGQSVSVGEWNEREDGLWELVLDPEYAAAGELRDGLEHAQGEVKTARAMLLDAFNEGMSAEELEGKVQAVVEVLDQADERAGETLEAVA